jgi:hypothetical protein
MVPVLWIRSSASRIAAVALALAAPCGPLGAAAMP